MKPTSHGMRSFLATEVLGGENAGNRRNARRRRRRRQRLAAGAIFSRFSHSDPRVSSTQIRQRTHARHGSHTHPPPFQMHLRWPHMQVKVQGLTAHSSLPHAAAAEAVRKSSAVTLCGSRLSPSSIERETVSGDGATTRCTDPMHRSDPVSEDTFQSSLCKPAQASSPANERWGHMT